MMEKDGVPPCRLDYNALTNLGYSKDHLPHDFAAALAKVNQEYFSYLATELAAGGVPAPEPPALNCPLDSTTRSGVNPR